jgi:hypothetical protein
MRVSMSRRLYSVYQDKYPVATAKYSIYLKYFKENFTWRFCWLQVDTHRVKSNVIADWEINTWADFVKSAAAVAELLAHSRRPRKFFTTVEKLTHDCKEHEDILVLSFNFLQNLPLPNIPVQGMFCLRQLCSFEIHDMKVSN